MPATGKLAGGSQQPLVKVRLCEKKGTATDFRRPSVLETKRFDERKSNGSPQFSPGHTFAAGCWSETKDMATVAKAKQGSQGGLMGTINGVKGWPDRFRAYVDGIRREMRLVTWPGRDQVRATTAVVLVTVFIFAVYFGIVDYVLTMGQTGLYGYFTTQ